MPTCGKRPWAPPHIGIFEALTLGVSASPPRAFFLATIGSQKKADLFRERTANLKEHNIIRFPCGRYHTPEENKGQATDLLMSRHFNGLEEASNNALFTLDAPVQLQLDETLCHLAVQGHSYDHLKIRVQNPTLQAELRSLWVGRLPHDMETRAEDMINLGEPAEAIFEVGSLFDLDDEASIDNPLEDVFSLDQARSSNSDDTISLNSTSDDSHAEHLAGCRGTASRPPSLADWRRVESWLVSAR